MRLLELLLVTLPATLFPLPAVYAARQSVYVTGTVQDFGSYTMTPALAFTIAGPGLQELGIITVDGLYNGDYPWIMRLYTENVRYAGVAGGVRRVSPAGLVSTDGQYVIPLEVHCPNFGPDGWRRVPDLLEDPSMAYRPSDDPAAPLDTTDCIIMGIDPRHAPWVAGPDGKLFTGDDNLLGDTTIPTTFDITVRARAERGAVRGRYEALLYVEIVPAP